MITINAVGQPCPMPVVRAKQALARLPAEGGSIQVLVDNHVATENLRRMAESAGHVYHLEPQGETQYTVTITAGSGPQSGPSAAPMTGFTPAQAGASVVAIGQDCMGQGSEELGKILIKGFIYALAQLDTPPAALLFFNAGITLALDGANTVDDLRALAGRGTSILLCGTCIDYYQAREKIAVGEIVNMMDIVSWMHRGYPVITL